MSTEQNITEHFWPAHLSGKEVKTKWPRGRNAVISRVAVEKVFDSQTNNHKEMVVVYFEEIERGLVTNKTNGRWLMDMFGDDSDGWIGKTVSITAAKRSNGRVGVDVLEAFEASDE